MQLLDVNSQFFFIISVTVAMLLIISVFSVYILTLFQKRKTRLLRQQQEIKENYEKEILRTQIEIRDLAMSDVGRELHDHISQVMTLVKLNMSQLVGKGLDVVNEKRLLDTKSLMQEAINDVRMLCKTLNGDLILHVGLVAGIQHELDRINRLNIINCQFELKGTEYEMEPNTAFIIFRIVQENLHNILKHARCKNVLTSLDYTPAAVVLVQQDDGVGFDVNKMSDENTGSGLINMRRRAKMINANLFFESFAGKGTTLRLVIDKKE